MTAGSVYPRTRTIEFHHHAPWFLGWCRWDITTTLHGADGSTESTRLAGGRWKWRGLRAQYREASLNSDVYWAGPPVAVDILAA